MDNWLNLNDPNQVKAYAPIIKRLTDPANFEHYRYTPITRDLSPGQRTLLYKFLDGPDVAANQPRLASRTSAVLSQSAKFPMTVRKMRLRVVTAPDLTARRGSSASMSR
jgi:hypothetical protein